MHDFQLSTDIYPSGSGGVERQEKMRNPRLWQRDIKLDSNMKGPLESFTDVRSAAEILQ